MIRVSPAMRLSYFISLCPTKDSKADQKENTRKAETFYTKTFFFQK